MSNNQYIYGNQIISGSASATYFVGDGSGLTNITASYITTAQTASYFFTASVTSASFSTNAISAVSASKVLIDYGIYIDTEYPILFSITSGSYAPIFTDTNISYNTYLDRLTVPNISASSITGSLLGTSSYAINVATASYATTASFAQTASYFSGSAANAISSSFATISNTASYVVTAQTASITSNLSNNGYIGGSTNGTQVITFSSSSMGATTSSLGTLISSIENNNGINIAYTIRTDIAGIHSDGAFGNYIGGTLTSTWYRASSGELTLAGSITQIKNSTFSTPSPEFTHRVDYSILGPTYKINVVATGKSGDTTNAISWKATSYIVTSPSVTI